MPLDRETRELLEKMIQCNQEQSKIVAEQTSVMNELKVEISKWNSNLTENGVMGKIKKALDRNFITVAVVLVPLIYIIMKDIMRG